MTSPSAAALTLIGRWLGIACVAISGTSASFAQAPNELAIPPTSNSQSGSSGYRIGAGDLLDIHVFGRPQLTRERIRVDASGAIRLPLVADPVPAGCATEVDLAAAIAERYRQYLVDPQVTVSVNSFNSQAVEVVGAVWKPGVFQLQREVRLREMLSIAGGVKPSAGMYVQLVHDENVPPCEMSATALALSEETTVAAIALDKLLGGGTFNPTVRPGDFINIPEAGQVFVVGSVVKPSALPLTQRLTVSRAVAMAGGRQRDSKDLVRLIRQNPDGLSNAAFQIDLSAIERKGEGDVELQAGDVVEVSASGGKQILKSVFSAALSAGFYYPLLIVR